MYIGIDEAEALYAGADRPQAPGGRATPGRGQVHRRDPPAAGGGRAGLFTLHLLTRLSAGVIDGCLVGGLRCHGRRCGSDGEAASWGCQARPARLGRRRRTVRGAPAPAAKPVITCGKRLVVVHSYGHEQRAGRADVESQGSVSMAGAGQSEHRCPVAMAERAGEGPGGRNPFAGRWLPGRRLLCVDYGIRPTVARVTWCPGKLHAYQTSERDDERNSAGSCRVLDAPRPPAKR